MLEEISLINFKLFKEATLSPALVTILIGPPGSGKSSFVQALQLLSQSGGRDGLLFVGEFENASFESLVHKKVVRNPITFRLKTKFVGALSPISDDESHELEYEISFDNGGFREQRALFQFSERSYEFRSPRPGMGRSQLPPPIDLPNRPRVRFGPSTYTMLPLWFEVEGRDYPLHQAMMRMRTELLEYFRGIYFVPDERSPVRDRYRDEGGILSGPPTKMEHVISLLASREDLRLQVSKWLSRIVERELMLRRAAGEIVVEFDGLMLPAYLEGAGTKQVVWPLGALALATPGALLAIEEPEIHLHPRAQIKLCDVMVEAATLEEKQLLLTTHSEHIVKGFLNAVAGGKLKEDELAVYYLEETDYVGTVTRLIVDEAGSLQGGLRGFFEVSLEELERYLEARAKRAK